ncbi:MAG: hypothetical protein IT342_15610 [Candidatus Melainabacteria bacterium]|nr:hypothetical protein [Candidatus Melainabacteria bacterium]
MIVFLVAGFIVVLAQVFLLYNKTLTIGFLLDDFVHLDYPFAALNGDLTGYVRTLSGNWSGQADGLTSFRPGISTSFVLDFLAHGLNPVGYHVTNLLVYSICVFLCGVIAYQLVDSKDFYDRIASAVYASALFLVYPLHVESVAWVIGRVDLFSTAFYLAALSLYFRFRKIGQTKYLVLSLLCFALSLVSKEMAVTLPAVIACAELLLPTCLGWQNLETKKRFLFPGLFVAALFAFAGLRTLLLGTLVGGYGASSFRGFLYSLHNFLDAPTLKKIVFGINEEVTSLPLLSTLANLGWSAAVVSMLIRLFQPLSRLSVFAFLTIWLVVSVVPTFQIWRINPNLVGSRLFFLGSASFCILLAVSLMPMLKVEGRLRDRGDAFKAGCTVLYITGLASLTVLQITWVAGLSYNLEPWIDAGKQMTVLQAQLIDLAKDPAVKSIVLLNLPQDFSGAGMVGNTEILHRMLRPPVVDRDYTRKIVLFSAPAAELPDAIDRELLKRAYDEKKGARWLKWSKDEKSWVEWGKPVGLKAFDSNEFVVLKKQILADCVSVENPKSAKLIWIKKIDPLDPFSVDGAVIKFNGSRLNPDFAKQVKLVWRSVNQPRSWIEYSEGPQGQWMPDTCEHGQSINNGNKLGFLPRNYRSWLLNGPIVEIGVKVPAGTYSFAPLEMKSVDASDFSFQR